MNQNRNEWLDIAKGIAIILMVVGHTSPPLVVFISYMLFTCLCSLSLQDW